ncbi:MAG TPA: DUF2239 family protein [Dongiaceae bacterium]|nr:DUF2239 family protein [Dongiaceae bacterium]
MTQPELQHQRRCIAFCDGEKLAAGSQGQVALAVKAALEADGARQILVFDAATSQPIDFDLRGDAAAILRRLASKPMPEAEAGENPAGEDQPAEDHAGHEPVPPRPGRPKLGVVAREVTLLPRHWDWLAGQPGGASVTLRKLVEAARRQQAGGDARRAAQEATYRFMSAMTGNETGFEEAVRALFADERGKFESLIAVWPRDLRDHINELASKSFAR